MLSGPKHSGEVSVGVSPAPGCSHPLFDGFLHRLSPPASLQGLQRPARRTSQLATTQPHRCGGRQSAWPRQHCGLQDSPMQAVVSKPHTGPLPLLVQ